MTCIIGLHTDDGVWIGADSAGSNEFGQQTIRADTKVFEREGMLFGFCGSYRMGQLLRFNLELSEHPDGMDDFEYMVRVFIEDVRKCLNKGGFTFIKNNEEVGGNFVVGYRDTLYEIQEDFQVGISTRDYVCLGSGMDVASGAMAVLQDVEDDPVRMIKRALKIVSTHDAYVAPPFHVKKLRVSS